jgi:hypothetical protein
MYLSLFFPHNGVSVHYVRNTVTGAVDDFKFK